MKLLLLLCLLALWPAPLFAFTANDSAKTILSDGTYSDTSNSVAYVATKAQNGWVLTVGSAGSSYSWDRVLNIDVGAYTFTVKGASANNRPSITSTYAVDFGVKLATYNNKLLTVRDIIFEDFSAANALFLVTGGGVDTFRFTNCRWQNHQNKFTHWVGLASDVPDGTEEKGPYGLLDHCVWTSYTSPSGLFIRENDTLTSWQRTNSWGSKEAIVLEDCVFHGTNIFANGNPAVDGDTGCRITIRHCTFTNSSITIHGSEGDPDTAPGQGLDSGMQLEVYRNTFVMTDGITNSVIVTNGAGQVIFVRGGSALVFSNTFSRTGASYYNVGLKMQYFRAIYGGGTPTLYDRDYPDDYVGTQQPGTGYVGTNGADPNFLTKPWGSVPIRMWGNTWNISPSFYYSEDDTFIQLDRDFFYSTDATAAMPGYSGYTYPHELTVELTLQRLGSFRTAGGDSLRTASGKTMGTRLP